MSFCPEHPLGTPSELSEIPLRLRLELKGIMRTRAHAWARARAWARVHVRACVRACVRECVRACVRAC
eukprot:15027341-Alexandrium_andersonii.AAC.1